MRVTPACELPEMTLNNNGTFVLVLSVIMSVGKLAIVNLMDTPLDSKCSVRIYGKSDDVFRMLMKHLKLTIPSFKWYLNIWIGNSYTQSKKPHESTWTLHVAGDCGFQSHFFHKAEVLLPISSTSRKKKQDETHHWLPMEGEDGIFEYTNVAYPELLADTSIKIKVHFIARLNVEPKLFQYSLSMKPPEKDAIFSGSQQFPVHVRDVVYDRN
jgi:hypothetical protein